MATRKPLVIIDGQLQECPAGDTLATASSEVDVVAKTNDGAGAVTIGSPVYVKANGNVDKASAAASGSRKVLGLVKDASIAASASGYIQTDGVLSATTAEWDAVTGDTGGLSPGADYFLSTTAGQLTTTPPSGSGQYVMKLGMAISTTEFEIDTDRGGVLLA